MDKLTAEANCFTNVTKLLASDFLILILTLRMHRGKILWKTFSKPAKGRDGMKLRKIENTIRKQFKGDFKLVFYKITDSTNLRAREYAKENPDNRTPTVFIAEGQTGGRGRLGRSFESPRGKGLYMSLLSYPEKKGQDATAITAYAALGLAEAIDALTGAETKIKWVNDLILGGKKVAGILTEAEMNSDGNVAFTVIGMGINVYKNALSEELSEIATSIEEATGKVISIEELAAKALLSLLSDEDSLSIRELLPGYLRRSSVVGEEINVIPLSGESYAARAVGINDDLSLRVITPEGEEKNLISATVSIRKQVKDR